MTPLDSILVRLPRGDLLAARSFLEEEAHVAIEYAHWLDETMAAEYVPCGGSTAPMSTEPSDVREARMLAIDLSAALHTIERRMGIRRRREEPVMPMFYVPAFEEWSDVPF